MLSSRFLETRFLEAWKKESSSEEDAARTIGTPITILGLSATMLSWLKDNIVNTPADFWLIILFGAFIMLMAFSSITIVHVLAAIKPRTYAYPLAEGEMITYAIAREGELRSQGMSNQQIKDVMEEEMSKLYLDNLAEMIANNRQINVDRTFRRSQALQYAIYTLVASVAVVAYLIIRAIGHT